MLGSTIFTRYSRDKYIFNLIISTHLLALGQASALGVGLMHPHHGEVLVVLGVVATPGLVCHEHLGALVRAVTHGLEPDVLGDVPAPVGAVAAQRALKRLLVQVADNVDVEPRRSRRPEGTVGTFVNLRQHTEIVNALLRNCTNIFQCESVSKN